MAKKQNISKGRIVLTIVIALAAWYFNEQKKTDKEAAQYADSSQGSELSSEAQQGGSSSVSVDVTKGNEGGVKIKFTQPQISSKKWDVLDGCELVKHRHNDGDSFHVIDGGGKKTEFRLYFVDTPESRLHQYNGERLDEQAQYFQTDRDAVIGVGKAAKVFVLDLLEKEPFQVVTQWENVYGPERKYCYVIVKWGGQEVYLHELLVSKGLVRIHTKPMTLPDNTSSSRQRKRLYEIQDKAKSAGIGGWGV